MTYLRYRKVLDYAIVDIVDLKHSSLRYCEIEREISVHCRVSSATLSRHLTRLVGRNVLHRIVEENGHTFYSLTKRFKESMDIQKKHYPVNYIEKTLSLHDFRQFDYSFTFSKERKSWPREYLYQTGEELFT